jgi:hypothetical protein
MPHPLLHGPAARPPSSAARTLQTCSIVGSSPILSGSTTIRAGITDAPDQYHHRQHRRLSCGEGLQLRRPLFAALTLGACSFCSQPMQLRQRGLTALTMKVCSSGYGDMHPIDEGLQLRRWEHAAPLMGACTFQRCHLADPAIPPCSSSYAACSTFGGHLQLP